MNKYNINILWFDGNMIMEGIQYGDKIIHRYRMKFQFKNYYRQAARHRLAARWIENNNTLLPEEMTIFGEKP